MSANAPTPLEGDDLQASLDGLVQHWTDQLRDWGYPRYITRDLELPQERDEAMLRHGIISISIVDEDNYSNARCRKAAYGDLNLIVVGQVLLNETSKPSEIENIEIRILQDIRNLLRNPPASEPFVYNLKRTSFSRQAEHPYGWVGCSVTRTIREEG